VVSSRISADLAGLRDRLFALAFPCRRDFNSRFHTKEGNFGGLGSSHTTPCGAAVPARPPTHRDYILKVDSGPLNGPMALPERVRSS
jgi:hypothetical protein